MIHARAHVAIQCMKTAHSGTSEQLVYTNTMVWCLWVLAADRNGFQISREIQYAPTPASTRRVSTELTIKTDYGFSGKSQTEGKKIVSIQNRATKIKFTKASQENVPFNRSRPPAL